MAGQTEAQRALFTGIQKLVEEVPNLPYDTAGQAIVIERLARAYRYAAGGAQPGSASSEK